MKPIDYAIVWLALLMLIGLRMRLHSSLPVFRIYITFELCAWFLLWAAVHSSYTPYFYSYWGLTLVRRVFMLIMLYEVGVEVLDRQLLVAWGIGIGFFLMLALTVAAAPMPGKLPLITFIFVVDRATSLLVCGVYFCAASLASAFGLRWRSHVLGVSLGIAVLSGLNLLYSALHLPFLQVLNQVSYLAAICVWLVTMTKVQPTRSPISPSIQAFITASPSVHLRSILSRSYTTTSSD